MKIVSWDLINNENYIMGHSNCIYIMGHSNNNYGEIIMIQGSKLM